MRNAAETTDNQTDRATGIAITGREHLPFGLTVGYMILCPWGRWEAKIQLTGVRLADIQRVWE